jgi:hypothetical protein
MRSATLARLETLLQARRLDRTISRPADAVFSQTLPTGLASIDTALGGGWRLGELSELVGGPSSGRTSLCLASCRMALRRGGLVGLVDAFDRFDPGTWARAGLDLTGVLWVRGPSLAVEAMGGVTQPPRARACASVVDEAVQRAVRAFDLIVRAGGFAMVVLDLADVSPRYLRRLPLSTWMRLAHANEGRDAVCLLLGDRPMGRSARGASIHLEASARWTGSSVQARRLQGFDVSARVVSTSVPGAQALCRIGAVC